MIGIDGGATFINNFIAPTFDDVTRLAGMILIGGNMDRIHDVAGVVPVYMVNPSKTASTKYQEVNETERYSYVKDVECYFNQELPLQKVMVKYTDAVDLAAEINYGYYNLLIKTMRVPVVLPGCIPILWTSLAATGILLRIRSVPVMHSSTIRPLMDS